MSVDDLRKLDTVAHIQCSNGIAVVSAEDVWVAKYSWCIIPGRAGLEYVRAWVDGKRTRLHELILGYKPGFEIDHINGNGLDCRRENLRFATKSQNRGNARMRQGKEVWFKGVSVGCHGGFRARIRVDRREISLGVYTTAVEAAHAYDNAARRYFGEFAALNFPLDGERGCN